MNDQTQDTRHKCQFIDVRGKTVGKLMLPVLPIYAIDEVAGKVFAKHPDPTEDGIHLFHEAGFFKVELPGLRNPLKIPAEQAKALNPPKHSN